MFALLKITISGYKMLIDNFTINFVPNAKVCIEDLETEILKVDENLYVHNVFAFTGSNSSGKSTTLTIIAKCLEYMRSGRWLYNKNDFSNDHISIHLEFYLDGLIRIYDGDIYPNDELNNLNSSIQFCNIKNEKMFAGTYVASVGKRYNTELTFVDEPFNSGMEDTSSLPRICKGRIVFDYIGPFSNNGTIVTKSFFECINLFNENLTMAIIKLLDESIEYIKYNIKEAYIRFKRFGMEEQEVTKSELLLLLSNGTIKGIELYIRVVRILKYGGILIVDEIENCFHKNLVNNILFLLTDKKINRNNAIIIFSTHYVEILDVLDRRDNINVLHKDNSLITIKNLHKDYDIRTEILKSKQFNNNTFNTLLNYDNLMIVKREITNEILNND